MEPIGSFLAIVLVFLLVAVPIIAILAFIRATSLQKLVGQIPQLMGRIYDLEQRLKSVDQRLGVLSWIGAGEAHPPTSSAAPGVTQPTGTFEQAPPAPIPAQPQLTSAAPPPKPPETPATPKYNETSPPARVRPAPAAASAPPPPPPPPQVTALPMFARAQANGGSDVESTIGGRWFNYVGILAISLAIAFFLK